MYNLFALKNDPKKYAVVTPDKKIIYFGASGYSDFSIHKDKERKQRYIDRHSKREDWSDLNKAGTWSRFILWNEPTIKESIKDMEKRFNIQINKLSKYPSISK